MQTELSKNFVHVEHASVEGYSFYCPGCKHDHWFTIRGGRYANWQFNGDNEKPSFSPSLLYDQRYDGKTGQVCHLYLTDGKLIFLQDCTHAFAGRTIALADAVKVS